MKIYKKTLFLFITLILIGTFYFYQNKIIQKREKNKEESKKVFIFKKENLKSIFIKNGEKELEILKLDENWIIRDKNYECDKNEITSLIEKISSLEYERNIGNVEDLSLYGLKNPQKLIEIKEDGKKFTLFIGEETPSGSYFYTTTEKKEVLLIYKWDLTGIIEKDVFSLRDKSIIPTDIVKSDLEEIEVRRDKIDFLLQRSGDNWYIKTPIYDLANKESVNNIIEDILDGKVRSFEEIKEKESGLEKPKIIIRFKSKEKEYFLYIGKKKNGLYYAKNSKKPYIFLLEEGIIDNIPDEINEIRERKLFGFNVSEVAEFSIIKKYKELKFIKEKDIYYLEKDRKKKISKDKVEDFLHDLKNLEIKDFIEFSEENLKKFSLLTPNIKIKVFDGKVKTEIYFGEKTENWLYCFHPERKIIFTLPSSDYIKIDKDENFFIEKEEKKK